MPILDCSCSLFASLILFRLPVITKTKTTKYNQEYHRKAKTFWRQCRVRIIQISVHKKTNVYFSNGLEQNPTWGNLNRNYITTFLEIVERYFQMIIYTLFLFECKITSYRKIAAWLLSLLSCSIRGQLGNWELGTGSFGCLGGSAASWDNDTTHWPDSWRRRKSLTQPRADNPINEYINNSRQTHKSRHAATQTQYVWQHDPHSPSLDFQFGIIIARLALIFHDLNMLIDYESHALLPTKERRPDPSDHWSLH